MDYLEKGLFLLLVDPCSCIITLHIYVYTVLSISPQALELQPEDRPCLVERSKCHLQLGDTTAALADAEASLKEDKQYHRVSVILVVHIILAYMYTVYCLYIHVHVTCNVHTHSLRVSTRRQKLCTPWEILSML